ncbi:MAG TPA: UDP-3-O-acyl-N-acetylglucosamine deacetylase [Rhizomicrobium sp.]|jgi:UDP-3-O-[3-hydroxymyristoyl] N-acetylglucosamine deacetylase|nr:UDP-3-O-acyl-N-acetylglucosamine deacetylase [Rhizomicrobium sp.]
MSRRTLTQEVSTSGTALHAGGTVHMTLAPAPAGTGIVFVRADLGGKQIPALYDKVGETRLGTVIAQDGASVGVIEHLMAAAAGAEIDDMIVTLDGPEPPILDGDALSYLALLDKAGIREQAGEGRAIKVLKRVEVRHGEASAALVPADAYSFDFEIVFPTQVIGTQAMDWPFSQGGFRTEIAPARTFGFLHELDALNKMGLGRGASLQNTLAIDGDQLVNAPLQRFRDEFVRHKILDALGDMGTAGAPLIARFEGRRSGHALNNGLLRALFADPSAWRLDAR